MNVNYHKWWSSNLGQDMEVKVYGQFGKPILVFPPMNGRFYDFENFGMIDAISRFVEESKVQVFTVDSIDSQSWTNWDAPLPDRSRRHEDFDRYIMQEVLPFIADTNLAGGKILTTGCSMGAYHAINFFFRHPDQFDAVIALSGIARLSMFVGDFVDDNVYFNSPILYLQDLADEEILKLYRQSKIVLCSGQGAWEGPMISDMKDLSAILTQKNIPHWLDLWGYDVVHDWPWWQKQLPYFLEKLVF
jgi:esterase/lipase superfamily enzyme